MRRGCFSGIIFIVELVELIFGFEYFPVEIAGERMILFEFFSLTGYRDIYVRACEKEKSIS